MCGLQVVAGERLDAPQFVSPRALSAFPGPGLDVSTRSGTAKPNTDHTIPPLRPHSLCRLLHRDRHCPFGCEKERGLLGPGARATRLLMLGEVDETGIDTFSSPRTFVTEGTSFRG